MIVLEHRYWGMSSPFTELTTENMQYLTLENSIADLTNFGECRYPCQLSRAGLEPLRHFA